MVFLKGPDLGITQIRMLLERNGFSDDPINRLLFGFIVGYLNQIGY